MPSLIGNKPNQVPSNGDLGTMAFRDQDQFYPATQTMGFKNRIINGAMMIDQRNAGASVTVNTGGSFYATDRFRLSSVSSSGVFTGQQITDAPTGFTNSLRVTVTTADASLGADDIYYCVQPIEGYNIADLGFGSAAAQTVTLSFWTKSTLTGTFGGSLSNQAVNRSYPFTYTINTANTWEYKTVTIAGDTTGTWLTNNDIGMRVYFGLGVGSNFTGTVNQWNSAFDMSVAGAVNVMGTLSATWQITGVQLEKGSTATSFDYRPYGTELALCQRYFQRFKSSAQFTVLAQGINTASTSGSAYTKFTVTMRSAPTVGFNDLLSTDNYTGTWLVTAGTMSIQAGTDSARLNWDNASGATVARPASLVTNSSSSYLDFTSEL